MTKVPKAASVRFRALNSFPSCALVLQSGWEGETLPNPAGGAALRAGDLGLLREPGGAGDLLREAPSVQEDEAALPRDRGAAGALQHGMGWDGLGWDSISAGGWAGHFLWY